MHAIRLCFPDLYYSSGIENSNKKYRNGFEQGLLYMFVLAAVFFRKYAQAAVTKSVPNAQGQIQPINFFLKNYL